MVKSVKQALENGEGCRVSIRPQVPFVLQNGISGCDHELHFLVLLMNLLPEFPQVYGMIDVQRVAGNFHISVHGLNIFVAEKVSNLKLQRPYDFSTFIHFGSEVCVLSLNCIRFVR
jgi:hypothetical protein